MANPSRNKGTAAETAVVRWFHEQGETQVDRHPLRGSKDVGDIRGVPSCVVSVKMRGRDKPMDFSGWLRDLDKMKRNQWELDRAAPYGATEPPTGLLVVRRVGYPDVGDWYAVQRVADWWSTFRELLT